MTPLDWMIVSFAVLFAMLGYRQGLIVGAAALAGLAVGAFAGGRLAPLLLAEGAESPYAPAAALGGAVLVGGIVAVLLEWVAHGFRARLVRVPGAGMVDGVGGAALLGAVALGLSWLGGLVVLNAPGADALRADVQRSTILKRLNAILPPEPVLNVLNRIDPQPRVEGPEPRVEAPDDAVASADAVVTAAGSVVRVLGTACGLGVQGSGWVGGPNVVVTNAHVIAGQRDTQVEPPGGSRLAATAVHYDTRNDLAVLRVEGLGLRSLSFAGSAESGAAAAVVGYPQNGPLSITPARVGATQSVLSQDSYGLGPFERQVTVLRGEIRSGNSGGPMVDSRGRVLGTIFASTTEGTPGGFAIPNPVVRDALGGLAGPVSTGPCAR